MGQNYRVAEAYYKAHGNLQMPHDYVDENVIRLGAWLAKMRTIRVNANYRGGADKGADCKIGYFGNAVGNTL